jgi:dihydrofolate synthase/folylpolyglutamate synthase
MISTFKEAVAYLETLIPTSNRTVKALRLERIVYLLKLLGNPHQKLKFVHIGGTSGKGSVAYLLSKLLNAQGYKVGLHLSPHLQKITERMQINDMPISEKKFINQVNLLLPLNRKVQKDLNLGEPTYFETLVAASFDYFEKEKVDIAIVEVGLGGTLDATNVIKPLLSIITSVGLDHTEILGKTVQKIARDKAGIIKEGSPVITGATQPSVREIIMKKAQNLDSKVYVLGSDFDHKIKNTTLSGSIFDFTMKDKIYRNISLSLLGIFQVENASLALMASHLLTDFGFKIGKETIYKALEVAKIPGRFEKVSEKPLIILDGAHNPIKMQTFLSSLRRIFPKKKFIFLVAFKKDKDIKNILKLLTPASTSFVVSEFNQPTDMGKRFTTRAAEIRRLIKEVGFSGKTLIQRNSHKALFEAKKLASKGDVIVVTGSLYFVGEIRNLFYPQ